MPTALVQSRQFSVAHSEIFYTRHVHTPHRSLNIRGTDAGIARLRRNRPNEFITMCGCRQRRRPACINVDLGLARMNAGLENGVGLEKQRDRANGHRGPTTFRPVPSFFSALLLSQSISSPAFSAPALGGRAVHVLLTKIMSISRPTHFASAV